MKTTNQIITQWLTGQCRHEWDYTNEPESMECSRCGHVAACYIEDEIYPDYENDLNAVREAELKAIEEWGQFKYLDALYLVMFGTMFDPKTNRLTLLSIDSPSPSDAKRATFRKLFEAWQHATWHLSSVRQQVADMSFYKLIATDGIFPFLFEEFQKTPAPAMLVALEALAKENPAKDAPSSAVAVEAWLKWGETLESDPLG